MIDSVDALLKSTLDSLCENVARIYFDGKACTFITYQLVYSQGIESADDSVSGTEYTYRVDIYSQKDYMSLLSRTKKALRGAGFYGIITDPEVFERDTKYYHVPIELKFHEMMEE